MGNVEERRYGFHYGINGTYRDPKELHDTRALLAKTLQTEVAYIIDESVTDIDSGRVTAELHADCPGCTVVRRYNEEGVILSEETRFQGLCFLAALRALRDEVRDEGRRDFLHEESFQYDCLQSQDE